jgi:hypothetical protein
MDATDCAEARNGTDQKSSSPDKVVEVPLTVSTVSCRASARDFHIFSDAKLTCIVKISIFCEIRFALQKASEWFSFGILTADP